MSKSKQKVYVVRYRHCTEIRYGDLVGVGDSLESAMTLARRAYEAYWVQREPTIKYLEVGEWLLELELREVGRDIGARGVLFFLSL